ncbi:hypothetical protein ACFLY7_02070 [Patescibacteria group bacterium]
MDENLQRNILSAEILGVFLKTLGFDIQFLENLGFKLEKIPIEGREDYQNISFMIKDSWDNLISLLKVISKRGQSPFMI